MAIKWLNEQSDIELIDKIYPEELKSKITEEEISDIFKAMDFIRDGLKKHKYEIMHDENNKYKSKALEHLQAMLNNIIDMSGKYSDFLLDDINS